MTVKIPAGVEAGCVRFSGQGEKSARGGGPVMRPARLIVRHKCASCSSVTRTCNDRNHHRPDADAAPGGEVTG